MSWKRNVYVPFINRKDWFKDVKELVFRNVALFTNMKSGLPFTDTYNHIAVIKEIVIILE